jgi:putative acetyltransferase
MSLTFNTRSTPPANMKVTFESPKQPEVLALIEALDAYQVPLYPAESHHGIDIDALSQPNVLFAVARDDAGTAIACGALVIGPEYGELKRMYTLPYQRGKGVARQVLSLLEEEARQRGCVRFMLETGYLQPEAIALYERMGYRKRGPFGGYAEDPNSVFMGK